MTGLTDNENGIKISGLDIFATETGSTVEISGLGVTDSSLHWKKMIKKESIVDDNDIGTIGLKISRLGVTGLNLRRGRVMEKRSTIDNNNIGSTGLSISSLGKTNSSLYCDGDPQCR